VNPALFLGTSLGFGTLSGINLYLVTCLTGLAIRYNLLQIHDNLQGLDALANPWIIGLSTTMVVLEMFADKIPYFDSTWDAVHTFIRPVGAIAACLSSIGSVPPEWSVAAALLAGVASATTHSAKMGTRLLANASPEPVSNVALSATEDSIVAAGTILLLRHPYLFAGLSLITLAFLWFIIPRIFRKFGGFLKNLSRYFVKQQR
jgi:hypothetical protein